MITTRKSQPFLPERPAGPSRRAFLAGAAAGGAALWIGFGQSGAVLAARDAQSVAITPFVKINADGTVAAIIKHFEMGQGTTTGLTTLIAEELDADWAQMTYEMAPADASLYNNLLWGKAQGTGGSTAIANSWEQYRIAGAAARELMVRAAAQTWGLPATEITVSDGIVRHAASAQSATFAELIEAASSLKIETTPPLKSPDAFKLIGRETALIRKDNDDKTDGTAKFGIDFELPDMVVAVIARPPKFGGVARAVDSAAARAVRGVVDVKTIPRGVVVYARSTWAAIKGRDALEISWDLSQAETRSSDTILAEHVAALDTPGLPARSQGDVDAALASASKTVEAEFKFPFLAHAPMEPLNCVIRFDGTSAELWDGCQAPSMAQPTVAAVLGLKPEQVTINTVYAGGSFGRRASPISDYHMEAALAVKAIDGRHPVKLVWTREDDIKGGYYRPVYAHRVRAGLDADGNLIAWKQALAGKSILVGTPFEQMLVKDGIDKTSVEGAADMPYTIPNQLVDIRNMDHGVPVLWWRAVGHTHTAYSTEIVMDMLAEAAGEDPISFRRKLLQATPRELAVLELVAEKADWSTPLGDGRGRGIAVHKSFESYVAEVVEVSVREGGAVKVDRVVCAVDCGTVVNPDIVRAQMEGGIGYGLGAVMRNKITLTDGEVDQVNFPDYEPLRIGDMPKVEVHLVASSEKPTGVGEPGTPPIGPALANAIYAATGKRIFDLPMTDAGIEFA